MTQRIRGGTISFTKLVLACCTFGLSIPFIGVRRGPSINIAGQPGTYQHGVNGPGQVIYVQPQPVARPVDWSPPAHRRRVG